ILISPDLLIVSNAVTAPGSSANPDIDLLMAPIRVTGPAPLTVNPNISCTSAAKVGSLASAVWPPPKVMPRAEASIIDDFDMGFTPSDARPLLQLLAG